MQKHSRRSLAELLVEKNLITRAQWDQARSEEIKSGDSFFKALARLGFMAAEHLANFIAEQTGSPRIELGYMVIKPDVLALVPKELARKHRIVPVFRIANSLTCAMADVFNAQVLDELAKATGMTIEPAVSTDDEVQVALDEYYQVQGDMQAAIQSLGEQQTEDSEESVDVFQLQGLSDEHPVVKFVNLMIARAVSAGASDIHVEPEEQSLSIRYRIDGILHPQPMPPKQVRAAITSRIKIMANLDIAEKRKPQDGRIQIMLDSRRIDIRVSFLPTVYGENVVMRLLDTSNILIGLDKIGLNKDLLKKFQALLARPNGIILVTGPTGSGKTTTLYSSVGTINSPDKSIVTVEDPVEYHLPGIRQTQVDNKVDLTFSNGLRAILRQDPDVIMIGEIRDEETAQMAIQAALTGHLVLATLHTNNAAGAITRLQDIGVETFLLASSVIGVVAQRLVRLKCRSCDGHGCKTCNMSGYKGRSGIYEMIVLDEKLREMVLRKASAEELHKAAVSAGMKSLRDDGMDKVAQGLTTQEEVYRVTQQE